MIYLKKFPNHTDYKAYMGGGEKILPNVSICDDEPTTVHYNPLQPEIPLANYIYMSHGYSLDEWNNGLRLDYTNLEYEYSGKTYSKFAYSYIDKERGERIISTEDDYGFVLFSTREFTKLVYPFGNVEVLQGYDSGEGGIDIYPFTQEWDVLYLYGYETEPANMIIIEHHDTSNLDENYHDYVDLGLPSGALWAKHPIGMTEDTDVENALYFAWGATTGCTASDTGATPNDWANAPFNNESSTFNSEYWNSVSATVLDNGTTLKDEYDAARSVMGGDWHMPEQKLLYELFDNTESAVTKNVGVTFTSTADTSKSLFIPFIGYRRGSNVDGVGDYVDLWSSSLYVSSPGGAVGLLASSDGYASVFGDDRYYGYGVLGVLY